MKIETNDIKVPEYMNLDFFKGVLEEGLFVINGIFSRIVFEMGSGAGDNYCSSIYRVKLVFKRSDDAKEEELSVIIKCIPITEATQFLENVGVYVVEKSMYQDIIPRMEILLNNSHFGAKMYYAQRQPIYTLAFEDLKVNGFTTAVRQDLLDEEHCRMIMSKLGQFHATSMVLAERVSLVFFFTKFYIKTLLPGPISIKQIQSWYVECYKRQRLRNLQKDVRTSTQIPRKYDKIVAGL